MKLLPLLFFFCINIQSGIIAQNLDLIPEPVRLKFSKQKKFFIFPEEVVIVLDQELARHSNFITASFATFTGKQPKLLFGSTQKAKDIVVQINEKMRLPKEGYRLKISGKGIRVEGKSIQGALHGYQTLLQILTAKETANGVLPFVRIKDYPKLEWRGMMLDVSRQFFDKEKIKHYIDWLAAHKINIFHWHLTDDNGWRIQIKSMPDLTAKGAWRGPDEVLLPSYGSGNKRYGGFYTQEDITEIVAFAQERGVAILPEIEIPGHSRAVIGSYPEIGCSTKEQTKSIQGEVNNVWCAGREENYAILEKIINEIVALFPFEYLHIAGDEVNTATWEQCSKCTAVMKQQGFTDAFQLQNYFFKRIEGLIEKRNKKAIGWNEIVKGGALSSKTAVAAWQGMKYGIEAVKRGHKTVMVPGQFTYFDMAQSESERGHRWAGLIDTQKVYSLDPIPNEGLTSKEKKLIVGVQGALWSEYLDRPARFLEYQSFPRIAALAEVGWSQKSHRNWNDFYRRLTTSHLNRLAKMGIAFRDFPPKASFEDGIIDVVPPYKGATIRFTDNGEDPSSDSPIFTVPIRTNSFEKYKFKSFYNASSGSPVTAAQRPAIAKWKVAIGKKVFLSETINKRIDKSGIWILSCIPDQNNQNESWINKMAIYENDKIIATLSEDKRIKTSKEFKFEIANFNPAAGYKMELEIENKAHTVSSGAIFMNRSKYIEPEVTVSSSMGANEKFPLINVTDYNSESYFRTSVACQKGDWVLYTFATPIPASRIEVMTGIPHHPRFIVNDGFIAFSYNGVDFEKGSQLEYGTATIQLDRPIKALKIQIMGTNNEPIVAFQDLIIYP
ncbi:MAG: beta-N-acetylhexosaminidase [Flavobacterium sp.]